MPFLIVKFNVSVGGSVFIGTNMQETDNIHFESMPDFGRTKGTEAFEEKEYDSLYDEIADKCHPNRFLEEDSNRNTFSTANAIYYELTQREGSSDEQLKDLRNRAIHELGIHFSTKKMYDHLSSFFDPRIYTQMEPYPFERVENAKRYYDSLNDNRDDIVALEQLEKEAEPFIKERELEIEIENEKKRKENEEYKRILNAQREEEEARKREDERGIKRDLLRGVAILGIATRWRN